MAITIIATPGDQHANSFAAETDYIGYVATRLSAPVGSTVTGSTCIEREKMALLEATRELAILEQRYIGQRATSTQALSWPRQFAINPDAPEIIGLRDVALLYFALDEVPQRVIDATCELAMQFLLAGSSDLASLDAKIGILRKKVGPIETEYTAPEKRAQGLARFPRVLNLLTPLFAPETMGLRMVRT